MIRGLSPPSHHGISGHLHRGLPFKVQADCWRDLRPIILWCKTWLMSNEGLGRLKG